MNAPQKFVSTWIPFCFFFISSDSEAIFSAPTRRSEHLPNRRKKTIIITFLQKLCVVENKSNEYSLVVQFFLIAQHFSLTVFSKKKREQHERKVKKNKNNTLFLHQIRMAFRSHHFGSTIIHHHTIATSSFRNFTDDGEGLLAETVHPFVPLNWIVAERSARSRAVAVPSSAMSHSWGDDEYAAAHHNDDDEVPLGTVVGSTAAMGHRCL
jgi:hypothetical protein